MVKKIALVCVAVLMATCAYYEDRPVTREHVEPETVQLMVYDKEFGVMVKSFAINDCMFYAVNLESPTLRVSCVVADDESVDEPPREGKE